MKAAMSRSGSEMGERRHWKVSRWEGGDTLIDLRASREICCIWGANIKCYPALPNNTSQMLLQLSHFQVSVKEAVEALQVAKQSAETTAALTRGQASSLTGFQLIIPPTVINGEAAWQSKMRPDDVSRLFTSDGRLGLQGYLHRSVGLIRGRGSGVPVLDQSILLHQPLILLTPSATPTHSSPPRFHPYYFELSFISSL